MKKPESKGSYVLKRMFAVFVISVIGIMLLIGFESLFHNGNTVGTGLSIMRALPYAGAAIFVAGVALLTVRRIKGISETELTATSWLVIGSGLFVAAAGILINQFFPEAFGLLYVMLCSITVLYMIGYIYQKEFFVSSILIVVATLGFYVIYRFSQGSPVYSGRSLGLVIAALAGCLALAALARFVLKKNNGVLKLGGKELRVLPHSFEYGYAYITLALIAAGLIVSLILGFHGAYYMMFGMLVLELAYAIYFTARLM